MHCNEDDTGEGHGGGEGQGGKLGDVGQIRHGMADFVALRGDEHRGEDSGHDRQN
jgi:hypothetical protein